MKANFKQGDLVITAIEYKLKEEIIKKGKTIPAGQWPIDTWDPSASTKDQWKRIYKIYNGSNGFVVEVKVFNNFYYYNVYFFEHNQIYRIRERNLELLKNNDNQICKKVI
jgi:hypothetical protein